MCDPYCQSGCACNQRCLINAAGAPTCSQPLAPGNLAVGQTCVVASSGTSSQTDACAPGSVCIREACGMHCFTYCRTDADCPNSTCSRPATELMGNPGGFKVCEVPFATCDPLKPHMDCPSTAETCYLSSVAADRTFCACHNGDKRENDPCDSTEDCFPGLVCVGAGTAGDSRCRAVCGMGTVIPCNGNATCRPVNGSKTYGYCL